MRVIQAFNSLLEFAKGNFSSNESFALGLAVLVDFLIFAVTIVKPNSSPPAPFSSWARYFSSSEYRELLSYLQVSKWKKCNFYIPLDSYLKGTMVPLTDNDLAVFKGEIYRWKFWKWFLIPRHIRTHGNGSGFGHYRTHHSCPAQWTIDFRHEERQREAASQEADTQQLSLYSDTLPKGDSRTVSNATSQTLKPKPSLNGNGSKGVEHGNPKASLNGNNKGVEDATQ